MSKELRLGNTLEFNKLHSVCIVLWEQYNRTSVTLKNIASSLNGSFSGILIKDKEVRQRCA